MLMWWLAHGQGAASATPFPLRTPPDRPQAWTIEDGLLQNSVTSIVTTCDGCCWLVTFGGLGRLDGMKLAIFAALNSPRRKRSRIVTFYEDRAGAFRSDMYGGGLNRFSSPRLTQGVVTQALPHGRPPDEGTLQRTAHLPPDAYRFSVSAVSNHGAWTPGKASLLLVPLPRFWQTWWFVLLTLLGVGGFVLLIYHQRISQLKRAKAAHEAFSRRLIELQEDDRRRIAAELHDSLTQSLVIIKNRALHSLQARDRPELALEQMEEIVESATQALAEVKQMAHDLRPFQIDRLGLGKAIEGMVRRVADAHQLTITTDLDSIDELLLPALQIHLYRIVQESLNNVVKHAAATQAHVTIQKHPQALVMTIEDNGKGFDPELRPGDHGGFGQVSLKERARILGASLLVQSAPGKGTTVIVTMAVKDGCNAP